MAEYGIVANVIEVDSAFRMGARAWLVDCMSGGERAEWIAHSRGGRVITKIAPTHRFGNFRCAWIPDHLRSHIRECGTKEDMVAEAKFWNTRADEVRANHSNRQFLKPHR